ncbi:MAG: tRNA (adenosine(37)-N6)-threonylcarbamoyltransferase complex dimerization subunit type 1 TsaB [Microcystaceae cyanobacterium]
MVANLTKDLGKNYGLALHTSSSQLGLGIAENGQIIKAQTWELGRELSSQLHLLLMDWLHPQNWSDLAYLAVAQGPGSFTSTRIGLVTARTLAQQLDIPIFALSSSASFAHSIHSQYPEDVPLAIEIAATRGQIYGAIYQFQKGEILTLLADQLFEPQDWQEQLKQFEPNLTSIVTPETLGYTVESLLILADQAWQKGSRFSWSEALPFYGMTP